MMPERPNIFNTIDKNQYRVKRRIVGQAVSDKALRAFEPTMLEQIDVLLDIMSSAADRSCILNMTDQFKRLGLDVVGHLAFGFALDLQTESTYRFIVRGIAIGTFQNNCWLQWPLLRKLRLHWVLIILSYGRRLKYLKTLKHMITTRLAADKHAKNDLYSSVMSHLETTGETASNEELFSEALFILPAG